MYFKTHVLLDKTNVNNSAGKTEKEYIIDARSGDTNAFERLTAKYINLLRWYVNSLDLPSSETDDLIQEGLIGLLKAVRSYDGVSSAFSTYAFHCMKNSIISAVRKYQKYRVSINYQENIDLLDTDTTATPESVYLNKENLNLIYNRLHSHLSDYELTVFDLYLSELSYKEIGDTLDKDVKSIGNAVFRIRQKIKQVIGEDN